MFYRRIRFWIFAVVVQLLKTVDVQSRVSCGGELNNPVGEIKSPRYPLKYPNNAECVWKIVGSSGSRITVTFRDFDVETGHSCGFDSLEIYNGVKQRLHNRIAKLCGRHLPSPYRSAGSKMLIRFHSDFSVGRKGFKLHYRITGCRRQYTALSGRFTSPNHPGQHPASFECVYNIYVPYGFVIRLDFTHFDLEIPEENSECTYDFVEVFDGPNQESLSLGRYCGNSTPPTITSSSNQMMVKFVADQTISSTGFVARYTAHKQDERQGCVRNNGGCSHVCTPSSDGRKCSCNPGYKLDFDEESCSDINECQQNNGGCQGACINTPGSFKCRCPKGFTQSKDLNRCENVDECAQKTHRCQQTCRDTIGSYYCACRNGWTLGPDGKSCVDINECSQPRAYHHCSQGCVNTWGSYYCTCKTGFLLSANGRICRDVDECMMAGVKCEHQCVNTPGSFHCSCFPGYRPSSQFPHKCIDIDECLDGQPDCHRCTNTDGSYFCDCDPGYSQAANRARCIDIDECRIANGGCGQVCDNNGGSYRCECRDGYKATDAESRNCEDIDECVWNFGKGDCDHVCRNTAGSYLCTCRRGYVLDEDGVTCRDINDCDINNGGCSQKCINVSGNSSCGCFEGFQLLGRNGTDAICRDIDECVLGTDKCDSGAICVNTPGNFACHYCPLGYRANGTRCEVIPKKFRFYQHLTTTGAGAVTAFEISHNLFVAFANRGSFNLDGSEEIATSSPIYVLRNDTFTLNQSLSAFGAQFVEYFSINGKHFLAVGVRVDSNTSAMSVDIYRWKRNRFQRYQVLPRVTAFDVCFYHLDNRSFLLFPNRIESKLSVFEWKNSSFTKVQSIETSIRAQACTSFYINNDLYVATGGWVPLNATTVYKWSGTQFSMIQTLESSYVSQLNHIVVGHHVYLAIASVISAVPPFAAHSNVYRWNGVRFVLFDAVVTQGSHSARFFAVLGETYLAVANQGEDINEGKKASAIYRLTQDQLVLHQEIQTTGASDMRPFVHKGQQYLVVANSHDGDVSTVNSTVYRWQD